MPAAPRRALPRSFFARPVLAVAPDLLGRLLRHDTPDGPIVLRVTEVEAYDGHNDPGSHAFRGQTPRNSTMFGPPGHLYVYFTYGMHYCVNVVCGPEGRASAVLLRAGEIVEGADLAAARRPNARRPSELAQGPARLTLALGIDRTDDGADACAPDTGFRLMYGTPPQAGAVRTGPRTGVGGDGAAHPWRFHIDADPTVSPYRAHTPRVRRNPVRAAADPSGTL
ncbi:DNA-3-methyladenine glycosylase [Yinghuangia seranimata]|uniref:DNA-3-methyladenine glycosylase n=1 Tax=Yinghuangia seranimata TaxID=408067 RepID=UPI00248C04BC|nr:DNA-3-methyladenine glycosylase [Yinghuangia seranimata]MDI2126410.1 DNA-3-methyladenine glycosylase [Yinghuangia seranimata]